MLMDPVSVPRKTTICISTLIMINVIKIVITVRDSNLLKLGLNKSQMYPWSLLLWGCLLSGVGVYRSVLLVSTLHDQLSRVTPEVYYIKKK